MTLTPDDIKAFFSKKEKLEDHFIPFIGRYLDSFRVISSIKVDRITESFVTVSFGGLWSGDTIEIPLDCLNSSVAYGEYLKKEAEDKKNAKEKKRLKAVTAEAERLGIL